MAIDSASSKQTTGNAVILVIVLLVFALVIGGFGLYKYKLGKKSLSWPTAIGKITYSRVEMRRSNKKSEYRASVKYSYTAGGRSYVGSRITVSDGYQSSRYRAERKLKPYPRGRAVTVYYDAQKPEKALLETGVKSGVYVMLLAGAACLFLAGAIAVSAIRRRGLSA